MTSVEGPEITQTENSATQVAYHKLRELILSGELAPGSKLKIDNLRDAIGAGRSPIREALSLLTSDQLVVRLDQRGFKAADTSPDNFTEILELRCILESIALRQSIENMSDDSGEKLVLIHHRMTRVEAGKTAEFERIHKEFHMALLEGSNSPILLHFCSQLYDLNIRYRNIAGTIAGYESRDIDKEHRDILDAFLKSEADQAVDLLDAHYRRTGAFLSEVIK